MTFTNHDCGALPVAVTSARFTGTSGVAEYHLSIRPTAYASFDTQLDWLQRAYRAALASLGLDQSTAVLRRFFCSDLVNQAASLHQPDEPCAVSWAGQAPLPPAKVALWAYHVNDPTGPLTKRQAGNALALDRNGLTHHWQTGMTSRTAHSSADQTREIFEQYAASLEAAGLSFGDNVMRTWLFVQDIDANYDGMVTARREFFAAHGLTPQTHFIASTGIGGQPAYRAAVVTLDAYAVAGLRREQVQFLTASAVFSPSHSYGVTFERGTAIAYRDRRHILISGTASIDHAGQILYPGDVMRQLDRTLENIAALLNEAGATLADMGAFIVYVRDPGDQLPVSQRLQQRCGNAPLMVVVAPVCRPGWLVEIEGQAIVPAASPELPAF